MDKLDRFIKAQQKDFHTALAEIRNGKKTSHWMWYIFPQIAGLGYSETAQYYAIENTVEAETYLNHPILGQRLIEISTSLLNLKSKDANYIFGSPDHLKLKSSMTLFAAISNADPVFEQVLTMFFNGVKDEQTLKRLA
ncbi:DUF1810 domain-containing protein [Pedobacter polaris]|uniref:DUF1810 domain-containing protein n=1 Tax=Pedobacter polaris TaxID=2571273 RepID=A0A4U1CSE2_9SPHI|nr:DUF1810 domain-containing protein [Pedobacter polaris]TKC10426.1 DUF1810 domain-containing protein [Pedobacter polaris]